MTIPSLKLVCLTVFDQSVFGLAHLHSQRFKAFHGEERVRHCVLKISVHQTHLQEQNVIIYSYQLHAKKVALYQKKHGMQQLQHESD